MGRSPCLLTETPMPSQNVLPLDRSAENRFTRLGPDDLNEGEIDSLLDLALKVLARRHRRGVSAPEDRRAQVRGVRLCLRR